MDSSSEDEDIIIIDDSSDEDSNDGRAATIVEAAVFHPRQQQLDENDDDQKIADDMDLTLQSASLHEQSSSVAAMQQSQNQLDTNNDDDVINVDVDEASVLSMASSSSSSSSGIPGPSPYKKSTVGTSHRPPSIIHTASTIDAHDNDDHDKNDVDLDVDEFDEDVTVTTNASKKKRSNKVTSAASKNQTTTAAAATTKSKAKKQPSKRGNTKNRRRATAKSKSKASSDTSIHSGISSINSTATTSSTTNNNNKQNEEDESAKHYHCYLLRSLHPDHPLKTYIGFTTNPTRRLKQHNGIQNGGANKTKRAGRPWTFVAIIHGFQDKITALQFEWAWQNVDKSKAFREAVGCDKLARKMKRRYGPKARLDELRWLVKDVQPFCLYSLTVYFPEREYCEIFRGIVARGKNGNPYKMDEDESSSSVGCRSEVLESLLDIQVSEVEDMPFARDIVAERERKKELRQRKKEERQAAKKKEKKKGDDATSIAAEEYSSDISSWLDTFDDDVGDDIDNWSELLDNSDHDCMESNQHDLSAIEEDANSSVISVDVSNDKIEMASPPRPKSVAIGMDDISSTLQSLSMDCVSQKKIGDDNQRDYDECDFSTISSVESDTSDCLMKDEVRKDSFGKENNEANELTATPGKGCDYFDLCSP